LRGEDYPPPLEEDIKKRRLYPPPLEEGKKKRLSFRETLLQPLCPPDPVGERGGYDVTWTLAIASLDLPTVNQLVSLCPPDPVGERGGYDVTWTLAIASLDLPTVNQLVSLCPPLTCY